MNRQPIILSEQEKKKGKKIKRRYQILQIRELKVAERKKENKIVKARQDEIKIELCKCGFIKKEKLNWQQVLKKKENL